MSLDRVLFREQCGGVALHQSDSTPFRQHLPWQTFSAQAMTPPRAPDLVSEEEAFGFRTLDDKEPEPPMEHGE